MYFMQCISVNQTIYNVLKREKKKLYYERYMLIFKPMCNYRLSVITSTERFQFSHSKQCVSISRQTRQRGLFFIDLHWKTTKMTTSMPDVSQIHKHGHNHSATSSASGDDTQSGNQTYVRYNNHQTDTHTVCNTHILTDSETEPETAQC